jgi:hypothetical protein
MLLHNLNVILQNPYVQHDRADPAVSVSARLQQGLAVGSDACENGCRRQHSRVVRLIGGAQQACQISAKAAKLVQVVCAAGFVRPVLQSPGRAKGRPSRRSRRSAGNLPAPGSTGRRLVATPRSADKTSHRGRQKRQRHRRFRSR